MEIIIADIGQRSYTLEFSKKEFKIYRKSLFCSASTNSKVQKWAGGSGHHESHPLPKTPPIIMCRPAIPEDWGHEADTKQKDIKKKKEFVVAMKQQSQFHFTSQQLLQQPKIHN